MLHDSRDIERARGGNAAFIIVLAFLGRRVIEQWLNRDIERFKSELCVTTDSGLERLRGALQIAASEHSNLLSRLQDKRAEVIDELYGLLATAIAALTSYVAIFEFAGEPPRTRSAKSQLMR